MEKGNVLILLKKLGIIATSIALAVLAFPISTANADTPKLVFKVGYGTQPRAPHGPFQEVKKPTIKRTKGNCSCVLFVKAQTGYSRTVGAARNWPVNSDSPKVGGVVVTKESKTGHVAFITAVRENDFDVIEANYSRCKVSSRTIKLNNPLIKGFWSK